MKTVNIAICDSNPKDRKLFENLCLAWAENNIPLSIKTYEDQIELFLEEITFDILLLEFDEVSGVGLKTAKKLRNIGYAGEIILLANNKTKNIISNIQLEEIYETRSADYFLKINSHRRFESVFSRVVNMVRNQAAEYILFNRIGEYHQIAIDSIRYFDIYKNFVCVHFNVNETFEFSSTLAKVSKELSDKGFLRVHRCYLASMAHILRLTYDEVEMTCGTKLPVGRTFYYSCKEALALFNDKKMDAIVE